MPKRETIPFGFEIARSSVLPDRDGRASDWISVPPSRDMQGWSDAQTRTLLDYRTYRNVVGQNRGRKAVREHPDFRGAGVNHRKIKAFSHILEYPITAEDLCTWLELLMDFAGSGLLRLKAIVRVADRPGPVLLHGVRRLLYPPVALPQWPSDDRRTRILLIACNLNEDCLRELLGVLTAAASAHARLIASGIRPALDRVAG